MAPGRVVSRSARDLKKKNEAPEFIEESKGGAMKYARLLVNLLGLLAVFAQAAPAAEQHWDDVLAKAKKEGKVILGTNLGMPKFRQDVSNIFKERYGIDVEIRAMRGAELSAVAKRECGAGRPGMDVILSGNSEILALYPQGCLSPVKPNLMLAEVVDGKNWRGGSLKFTDPEEQYTLQLIEYISVPGIYNTELAKPGELSRAKNLLDPKFKGKIASFDPRRGGSGRGAASFFLAILGDEFVTDLYKGQEVVYTTNHRQLADWVARGVHVVGLGAQARAFDPLKDKGLPIGILEFEDMPGKLTGGSGVVKLTKGGPHPNAAVILLNWIASKEGQETFEKNVRQKSRRVDVDTGLDAYMIPKAGAKYHDDYAYDFYTKERPRARKRLIELLGR